MRFFYTLALVTMLIFMASSASAQWSGVDETVVEKFAEEHGREAVDPLINTDQGDLLLFVFLIGGALGGFVGGYYWRMLNEPRPKDTANTGSTGAGPLDKKGTVG